jgi:SPP1 gp7 family putative phage head morphogenesis protein
MSIALYSEDYLGPIASGKGWMDLCAAVEHEVTEVFGERSHTELEKFCEEGFSEDPGQLRKDVLFFSQLTNLSLDVRNTAVNLANLLAKAEGIAIASDSLIVEDEREPAANETKTLRIVPKPPEPATVEGHLAKALTDLLEKPMLCVDFDGTLVQADPDNPTAIGPWLEGAIDALRDLSEDFNIVIFTARNDFEPVWEALRQANASAYVTDITSIKPQDAFEFLDERSTRFEGEWTPEFVDAVRNFQPYWKAGYLDCPVAISGAGLAKVRVVKIHAGYSTPEIDSARKDLQAALERVFRRQQDRAKEKADRLLKAHAEMVRALIADGFGKAAQRISATMGIRKPSEEGPEGGRTEVQSLIFMPKEAWTKEDVREWLKEHDFKTDNIMETDSSYRARQEDEDKYIRIRTVPFKDKKKLEEFDFQKVDELDEDAVNIADEIYAALHELFGEVPETATGPLARAAMAGTAHGVGDLELYDSDMIASLNAGARTWAAQRAAELVGMRRQPDGALIENPDAKWAISDTTRDDLRHIISDGFTKETPMPDLIKEIGDAGAFSDSRAAMIARTETSFAQSTANYNAWRDSGIVDKAMWQASADPNVCDDCLEANGEVVSLGETFPGVDVESPPAHVNCDCSMIAVSFNKALGKGWVTIRGAHVFINEAGIIEHGPPGLVGQRIQSVAPKPPQFVGHRYGTLGDVYNDEKGNELALATSPEKGHCEVCGRTIKANEEFYQRNRPSTKEENLGWQHVACAREEHLSEQATKVEHFTDLGGGHVSVTRWAEFPDGTRAVFKPHEGEGDIENDRRGFSAGLQTERECAAWQVAKVVHMDDLVAPAADVTTKSCPRLTSPAGKTFGGIGKATRGAVLECEAGEDAHNYDRSVRYDGTKDVGRAAAFDYVIGNTDRHAGNWLVHRVDDHYKMRLIDHGYSFPDMGDYKGYNEAFIIRACELQKARGGGIGTPMDYAKEYVANENRIAQTLRNTGLPKGAIDGVKERIHFLATTDRWDKLPGTLGGRRLW